MKATKTAQALIEGLNIKFDQDTIKYDTTGLDYIKWGKHTYSELTSLLWTFDAGAELVSRISWLQQSRGSNLSSFYTDMLDDIFEALQEAWKELDMHKVRKHSVDYFETVKEMLSV